MDKNSKVDSVVFMPLKARTFKTLSRLMTDNELAISIAIFGEDRYLRPREFIEVMRPRRIAKLVYLAVTCVAVAVAVYAVIMAMRHMSSPTTIMYSVGIALWVIPAYVFAHSEHEDNIRKGRTLSRVFWLAEFRNYRYIGQVEHTRFLPYFDMTEPSAADYNSTEA